MILSPDKPYRLKRKQIELERQNEVLQKNLHSLQAIRDRYWDLYEFAPIGYFCLNEKNVITEVNFTGAKLLGIEKSNLLQKKCLSSFIAEDYGAVFYEHCQSAFMSHTKKSCEVQIIRKDGTHFYAYLESVTGQTDQENNKQLRLSMMDVTSRKMTEEQAAQHQLALYQAGSAYSMGGMASALAHELTQPLTAITNFVNGCVRRLKTGNYQQDELVDIMQQTAYEAERAGKVLHNIKEFVSKGKPNYAIVNVQDIIQATVTSFRKELVGTPVAIGIKLSSTPLYLRADKIQIELVLLNFLRNGKEAMKNSHRASKQLLTIHTHVVEKRFVKIAVIDTGHGLEKDTFDKIFDPYFTTKSDGLGMGLWVCRSMIETHGGQLTAESVIGGGACFAFTLPLSLQVIMLKIEKPIVIIVEDDAAVCRSLSWLFGSVNIKTEIYSTAGAYLHAYNPNQYSCLLLDIRLPDMSGLQLLEVLLQRHNPIPVIIITGHGDVNSAIRAMKLGAKDFILKPFNDDALLEQIQKILAESYEHQKLYRQFFDRIEKLTAREKEIMALIVKGKLNKLIASELSISLSTVELHRANIIQKLQVNSLAELVKIDLLLRGNLKP